MATSISISISSSKPSKEHPPASKEEDSNSPSKGCMPNKELANSKECMPPH